MKEKIDILISAKDSEYDILQNIIHKIENIYDCKLLFDKNEIDLRTEIPHKLLVIELNKLSFNFFDWTIAALSERLNKFYKLIIKQESYNPAQDLRVRESSVIGCYSKRISETTKQLRPDCEIINLSLYENDVLMRFILKCDAFIIDTNQQEFLKLDESKYNVMDLHPTEFIPTAGSGVYAILCKKENIELRKNLAKIHESDVANCTNVERIIIKTLNQTFGEDIGIYCYKDINGYYHVNLSIFNNEKNELNNYKYSQSTNYQLTEKILELIRQ
jgi:hydroxymethylbilane synthase